MPNKSQAIIDAYNKHNGSLFSFYRDVARKKFPELKRQEVERILLRLPNFSLFQYPTRISHMDCVRVYRPGSISLDIAFMENAIIFIAVDQFSRYIFAQIGASKTVQSSLEFFEHVNSEMQKLGYLITAYSSDLEKAFLSGAVQNYVRSKAQAYFLQTQNVHNSTCENAVRHLKRYVAKNKLALNAPLVSEDVLEAAVNNLNSMRRRVLGGFSAEEVMQKKKGSWAVVQAIVHGNYLSRRKKMSKKILKKGTRVRIKPHATVYGRKVDKGIWSNYSQFFIHKVLRGRAQVCYRLKEQVGKNKFEPISSIFYANEVIPVHKPRS